MRLSAHIGYLFSELPLAERPAAAAQAGFTAIEHPQPFAIAPAEMGRILRGEGLVFAQMAAGTGDAARGEKGIAALPGREAEFRDSLDRSLDYAEAIGCSFVHPMAGVPAPDADPDEVAATYEANLVHALGACRGRSVDVLVEAISHAAVPGYFLSRLEEAAAWGERAAEAARLGGPFILVDTFHARANGEDAAAFVASHGKRIGHIHIADHPGRHEPGSGAIDFEPLLQALEDSGYSHAVGFEYIPAACTGDGLGWLARWRERLELKPVSGG